MKKAILAFALSAMLFIACQQPAPSNQMTNSNTTAANAKWDAYVEQFLNDYFAANPPFAVNQGRHEFDGKLPDWSAEGLSKEIARLKSEREKASAFKDNDLDLRQRFERDYLISQIDSDVFWRETADQPHNNPYWYSGPLDPDTYVSREYAPLETRIKSYTAYAKNVPAALDQIKAALKLPLAKNLARIGSQTIGGLADFYEKDVVKVFEPVKDEQLQKEFKDANTIAAKAVREFKAWIDEQEKVGNDNFALGPEKFRQM